MTVSMLARSVGVSPSLISQIERGHSRPSVSTLVALANALGVSVDALFRDRDAGGRAGDHESERVSDAYVVRRGERAAIDIDGGVRWEQLTPVPLRGVEFKELVYSAHGESNPSLYRHPGMEMVLVLEGELDIFVGLELCRLGEGDSICFPSTTPHRYVNPTRMTTRAVTVTLAEADGHGLPTAPQED
jgi:transcriptional regulator with XRE-family HTH domain